MSDRRDFLQILLASALTADAAHAWAAQPSSSDGAATATATAASTSAAASTATDTSTQAPATTTARSVHRQLLPAPFEGLDAAFVGVTIPPGVETRPHRHSGFVLGYVIEGQFRFGTNGEAPRTVKAGETFYEAPGSVHTTAASASRDRPVKILAIVIGPQGAPITTYEQ